MSDESGGPYAVKRQDRITKAVFPVQGNVGSVKEALALAVAEDSSVNHPMRDIFFVTDNNGTVVPIVKSCE